MDFRKILLIAAATLAFAAGRAQAQFGVYGTVVGTRLTNVACLDTIACAAPSGTAKPYGVIFGAQYDFRAYGPVTLGFDLRGATETSNKRADTYTGGAGTVRVYNALGGVRGTLALRKKLLRPYAELTAGLARTNLDSTTTATAPAATIYTNHFQVQGLVGLDLALFPNMDFRAIELGYGEMFGTSSHGLQQIGVGVVFHTGR